MKLERGGLGVEFTIGAIGCIPTIGPIIQNLIAQTIPDRRWERIEQLVTSLGDRIAGIDAAILERRMSSPAGVDLLEDGFLGAARATSTERIEHIAKVLANGFSEDETKLADHKFIMTLLAELSDEELVILFYERLGRNDAAMQRRHADILCPPDGRETVSDDRARKVTIFHGRCSRLERLGLLYGEGLVRKSPDYDLPPGTPANHVTPLGRMFLKAIQSNRTVWSR